MLVSFGLMIYASRPQHPPVLHGVERLLVGDVVHEDEAHGSPVVCRGDGAVTLLTCRVLESQIAATFGGVRAENKISDKILTHGFVSKLD